LNQLLSDDLVEYLEDIEDIKEVTARAKERGKGMPLDRFIKKLSKNG
jgi:hypothetical protein